MHVNAAHIMVHVSLTYVWNLINISLILYILLPHFINVFEKGDNNNIHIRIPSVIVLARTMSIERHYVRSTVNNNIFN